MVENCKLDKKLYPRNYRSLSKYKQNNYSYIARLNENIQNKGKYEKEDIRKNEKETKGKNSKSSRTPLNKAQYYTEVTDYDNGMFDGKHFHFEKKWIKKKDYDYIIEKNRRICDIALKKIRFRDYGFGVIMFFIFILIGIGYPILQGLGYLNKALEKIKELLQSAGILESSATVSSYTYPLLFSIMIIILSIIIIISITKILINNEKYKKIKLMTE
ncbi:Plasmodium exported protein (Pm-fam-a like), unknown function [Plasmodium malariae]|uniref:Fam-m protein n=1 Tax=Plasmodium malariae TaxID=5858 RepID=A0A1A8WW22_PLAMA|nr:Plasmodium exported protein (Pm-fam-a like), unknown function [Plasmodium malariae]